MRLPVLLVCLWLVAAPHATAQTSELAQKSQQVHELMAAGKFEQAIPIYRKLLQAAPGNPGLQMDLGMALHMAGRDREAVPPLEAALQQEPASFPANLFLGLAHLGAGAPAKAIPPLTKAAKLQPSNPDPQQALASAFMALDRFEEASQHYRKFSELVPQAPGAWAGLGQCYEALAQAEFERLGRVAKDSGYWFALMAEARLKTQQYKSAYEQAAMFRRSQRRYGQEAEAWREALKVAPGDPEIETQLAFALNQTGDYGAAQALLLPSVRVIRSRQ